ncbi:MAG: hypothetical protein ACKPKO_35010, partial [Candidatus Fonsibacter sp.]
RHIIYQLNQNQQQFLCLIKAIELYQNFLYYFLYYFLIELFVKASEELNLNIHNKTTAIIIIIKRLLSLVI